VKSLLINSKSLLTPLTGIGRYSYEIVSRLPDDGFFEYLYYYYGKVSENIILGDSTTAADGGKHQSSALLSTIRRMLVSNQQVKNAARNLLNMYSRFFGSSYDLYWEPGIIPVSGIKSRAKVVTVHDMSLHLHESWHLPESVKYFRKNFWGNIEKADYIITDTQAVKCEVAELVNFPADRIMPIHLGLNNETFRRYSDAELAGFDKLPDKDVKYILFVGSIEPRKNLERLIQAYAGMPERLKKEYKLLLVGYKGWNNKEIHSQIEAEKENVYYLGFVTDRELAMVYNLAHIFVYPSLYEGFGLPPLEAMACGVPVLTSDIPCIKEVCQDATYFIDPLSAESIRDGLTDMIENSKVTDGLRQKGLEHIKKFDWNVTAVKHYDLFKELA